MDVGIKTANDQFQSVTTAERTAIASPVVGQCVWDSTLRQIMVYMNATTGNAWQPLGNRIVCASTTRPLSPFEGQEIYETDTNKTLVYTGAAWFEISDLDNTGGVSDDTNNRINDSGMVIITPTSVSGSGMSSSNGQISLSAVTTGIMNGLFTSAYSAYEIVLSMSGAANNQYGHLQLTASGTASAVSYAGGYRSFDYSAVNNLFNNGDGNISTKMTICNPPNSATYQSITKMTISNPAVASLHTSWTGISTGSATTISNAMWIFGGVHAVAATYDGLAVSCTSGSLTGTIRVYGYQNS